MHGVPPDSTTKWVLPRHFARRTGALFRGRCLHALGSRSAFPRSHCGTKRGIVFAPSSRVVSPGSSGRGAACLQHSAGGAGRCPPSLWTAARKKKRSATSSSESCTTELPPSSFPSVVTALDEASPRIANLCIGTCLLPARAYSKLCPTRGLSAPRGPRSSPLVRRFGERARGPRHEWRWKLAALGVSWR